MNNIPITYQPGKLGVVAMLFTVHHVHHRQHVSLGNHVRGTASYCIIIIIQFVPRRRFFTPYNNRAGF
jgi:hypothetical protein